MVRPLSWLSTERHIAMLPCPPSHPLPRYCSPLALPIRVHHVAPDSSLQKEQSGINN